MPREHPARRFGLSRKEWSPVERRRRRAARTALYSSLCLTAVAGWLGGRAIESSSLRASEQAWSHVDFKALPEVQLLSSYVRIDTSPGTGSEVAGVRFLAAELRAAGIEPTVDIVDDKHANLWAVIEGESPRAVVLHHHIDVTSADPAEWAFPPFDGLVQGPWIRGRGTFDMKSVAIAQLLAFLDVHRARERPERSLILLATSAEEEGSMTGMQRLIAQQPELLRRCDLFITEGGALEARSTEDIKYWGIEFAQRRYVRLLAHAGRDRLETLRRALDARGRWEGTPRLTPEARLFLDAYGSSRDSAEFQQLLRHPESLADDPARVAKAPPIVHELLVDTLVAEPIRTTADGQAELPFGLLLLPGTTLDAARAELLPDALLDGVAIETAIENPSASGSSLEHPGYAAMRRILRQHYGNVPVGPYMLGHTLTDARFARALGIPAYGFSPFLFLSIDTYRVDKLDERIGLPGYVAGVATYRELVDRLVKDRSQWN